MMTLRTITTPVTESQVVLAADAWEDVVTPDGQMVYPGSKLQFLLKDKGRVAATEYLNARADLIAEVGQEKAGEILAGLHATA